MMNGHTLTLTLFGKELGYSGSPALHNSWLQQAGWNAVYVPLAFSSAHMFLQAVRALMTCPHFAGGNITNPFKSILSEEPGLEPDERVRALGACNTIFRRDTQWCLANTDVDGVLTTLELWPWLRQSQRPKVIILGAGGAAAAVAYALADWFGSNRDELQITVVARKTERAHCYLKAAGQGVELVESPLDGSDHERLIALAPPIDPKPDGNGAAAPLLVINGLPIGHHGEANPSAEILIRQIQGPLKERACYFDLTYGDGKALQLAKAMGLRHSDGRIMLEAQARKSFLLWESHFKTARSFEKP